MNYNRNQNHDNCENSQQPNEATQQVAEQHDVCNFVTEAVYFELTRRRLLHSFKHDSSWADMHEYIKHLVSPYKLEPESVNQICEKAFKILDNIATNPKTADEWSKRFESLTHIKLSKTGR